MAQSIQDSLRDLLYLARNADIPALKKEKANLELRLSAINNIIAWNEQLHTAVDLDAAPIPGKRPPVTSSGPPQATGPAPLYDHDRNPAIVNNPPEPKKRGPRKKKPPEPLPPRCVDHDDPPETHINPDDPSPPSEEETGDEDFDLDTPEAKATTQEIAGATAEKKRFKFAELMSDIVSYLGKHGRSQATAIYGALGITGGYFSVMMADPRLKARVQRVDRGVYELTAAGHEMYEGLSAPAQTSWK